MRDHNRTLRFQRKFLSDKVKMLAIIEQRRDWRRITRYVILVLTIALVSIVMNIYFLGYIL